MKPAFGSAAPDMETRHSLDAAGKPRDLSSIVTDMPGEALLPESLEKICSHRSANPAGNVEAAAVGALRRAGPQIHLQSVLHYFRSRPPRPARKVPKEPVIIMKVTRAICWPQRHVLIPRNVGQDDWEV